MSDMLRAAQSLRTVRAHLVDLRDAIEGGLSRPRYWASLPVAPEVMAARDEAARAERAERTDLALGECEAPMDVSLLDTEQAIIVGVLCVEAMCRHAVGLEPRRRANDDAGNATLAIEHSLDQLSEEMVRYVAREAEMWDRVLREALGLSMRPLVLKARCPWCTTESSLRLYPVDGDPVIVCTSGVCDPGDQAERWMGRRPAWSQRWWPFLAARLNQAA